MRNGLGVQRHHFDWEHDCLPGHHIQQHVSRDHIIPNHNLTLHHNPTSLSWPIPLTHAPNPYPCHVISYCVACNTGLTLDELAGRAGLVVLPVEYKCYTEQHNLRAMDIVLTEGADAFLAYAKPICRKDTNFSSVCNLDTLNTHPTPLNTHPTPLNTHRTPLNTTSIRSWYLL